MDPDAKFFLTMVAIFAIVAVYIGLDNLFKRFRQRKLKPETMERLYYHVPGIFNCPCCGSSDVAAHLEIVFPEIKTNTAGKDIYFPIYGIKDHWNIECNECGVRTTTFGLLGDAIMSWNGRSNMSDCTDLTKQEE